MKRIVELPPRICRFQRILMIRVRLLFVAILALTLAVLARPAELTSASGPLSIFGGGGDGSHTYPSSTVDSPVDSPVFGTTGSTTLNTTVPAPFSAGQRLLIHQSRGAGAGSWEINEVASNVLGTLTMVNPLANTYQTGGADDRAQALVIPQYTNLTVNAGITVTAKPWNGSTGGIFAAYASTVATIDGTIDASGAGFRGGQSVGCNTIGYDGEGTQHDSHQSTSRTNFEGNAGLSGFNTGASGDGGGGGGNGSPGGYGGGVNTPLFGGLSAGTHDLAHATFGGGGGGGSGGNSCPSGAGGNGGGFIYIAAATLTVTGGIRSDGQAGSGASGSTSAGAGGAGGSVKLISNTPSLGSTLVTARGGNGGTKSGGGAGGVAPGGRGLRDGGGGAGGAGHVRLEFCATQTGTTDPPASVALRDTSCGPAPVPPVQLSRFGDGSDGNKVYASSTTIAPIDSVASGLSGTDLLNATNPAFAAGQQILIHQSRGSAAGQWEVNAIRSYSTGRIVTVNPLAHTYVSSFYYEAAQVLVIPQYLNLTVNSGVVVSAKPWNGSTGGILAALVAANVNISGDLTASASGFRGGASPIYSNDVALDGEGSAADTHMTTSGSNNEGSAGLGDLGAVAASGSGGGGGGNRTTGGRGWAGGDQPGSLGGLGCSLADLTLGCFGGAGAGGSNGNTSGAGPGGNGGGFVFLGASTVAVTGSIRADGSVGTSAPLSASASAGGGGAGGAIKLLISSATLGTNLVTARGGNGGAGHDGNGAGVAPGGDGAPDGGAGAGGNGTIRVEYCGSPSGVTGFTSPVASVAPFSCATTLGGNDQDADPVSEVSGRAVWAPRSISLIATVALVLVLVTVKFVRTRARD